MGLSKTAFYGYKKNNPNASPSDYLDFYRIKHKMYGNKTCKTCGEHKGFADFPKAGHVCKACASQAGYERYKRRMGDPEYAAKEKLRQRTARREKYHSDEEFRKKIIKKNNEYRDAKLNSDPDYKKQYLASGRIWRRRKTETDSEFRKKLSTQRKKWASINADKVRYYSQARRARVSAKECDPSEFIDKVKKNRCYWCNKDLKGGYHLDHVVPLDKGGRHIVSNIVASCPHCNLSKGAKMPNDWIEEGQLVLEMF